MDITKLLALGVLRGGKKYYNPTTTRYVRKDGNDTTGDGTTAKPWLTISKAIATLSGGPYVVRVGTGDYAEGGAGTKWNIDKSFSDFVTIQPESERLGDVTIHGGGAADINMQITSTAFLKFSRIDFTPTTTYTRAMLLIRGGSTNKLTFSGCRFPDVYDKLIVELNNAAGNTVSNLLFENCIFTAGGAKTARGFTCANAGMMDTLTFSGCSFSDFGGTYGLQIGVDGATGGAITNVTISGCTFTNCASHTLLIGAGVNGATITGNNIAGMLYGIVLKECQNVTANNNSISAGSNSGLYFKAAQNCTAQYNTIANTGIGFSVAALKGDTNNKCANINFTHNSVSSIGAGALYSWGDTNNDAGGSVVDYNEYHATAWGFVWGSAISSLATLQAAWATYGDGSNDSHSTTP